MSATHKTVPVEPTVTQITAAIERPYASYDGPALYRDIYRAMIEAAPASPPISDAMRERIVAAALKWARLRAVYRLIGGTGRALIDLADAEEALAALLAELTAGGTTP